MNLLETIWDILAQALALAGEFWWLWVPVVLGFAAYHAWFDYKRAKFIAGIKWVTLEIIPPPEILYSSPRAAENIFAGLHASYGGGTGWKPQFFQGKVPAWIAFETVADGDTGTHFIVRCPSDQRNLVEAQVFAQYPSAEIRELPDYVELLPEKLDLTQYDMIGAELEFTKDSPAYPIKTYPEFEEAGGKDEYARLDPIAPLVEIMSALRPGEHLWVQYLVRGTGGDWVKEAQATVDKLKGKKTPKPGEEPPKDEFNLQKLTAAERKVLELVEFKLAKLAFKTGIRIIYAARKDAFNGSRIAAVTAMFKQLYYNNLNSFKPTMAADKGSLKWIFPNDVGFGAASKTAKKKAKMYGAYRNRMFPAKLVILNTEELATLWHLPGLNVKAPMLPRVQAKKGQPPSFLPTR